MRAPALVGMFLAARASCNAATEPPQPAPHAVGEVEIVTPEAAGPSGRVRPREIAARHVLVMYHGSSHAPATVTRTREEARARAEEVLRRARAHEDFAALAREFSDEPGADTSGGALPRFRRGAMVPDFERAAFALEVGEISGVIETDFGFHVILRTE